MEASFKDAASLFAAKKYHEAIRVYVRIASDKTSTPADRVRALNNISACYNSLRDYSKSLDVAMQVLALDGDNAKALGRAATAHEGMKQYEAAVPLLQRAVEIEPENRQYLDGLSRVQGLIKDGHGLVTAEAKDAFYYEKSLKKGKEAMAKGEYVEAVRHYSKALDLLPARHTPREEVVLMANRSAAHFRAAHFTESAEDARTCTRLDPTYARGFFRLACAHEKLCNVTGADEALKACLAIEPHHSEALALQQTLRTAVEEAQKTARQKAMDRQKQREAALEDQREAIAKATTAVASTGTGYHARAHGYTCCTFCNENGHTRAECPLMHRKRPRSD